MTDAAPSMAQEPASSTISESIPQSKGISIPQLSSRGLSSFTPQSKGVRSGHLNLDTFSPVNQNGSFEFDRVLKTGTLQKRTKKTKTWKPVYLVLRPNLLSIYKNAQESRLRNQINLSELTAIASLKDKKQKRQHVFGLFSPSKNYHLEASSDAERREWVELIRREARIDEEEHEMSLLSPGGHSGNYKGFERHMIERAQQQQLEQGQTQDERFASSSPEPADPPRRLPITRDGVRVPGIRRPSSHVFEYSGNEMASYSDLSDTQAAAGYRGSSISLTQTEPDHGEHSSLQASAPLATLKERPSASRNVSQQSAINNVQEEQDRVVWQGYLLCLKTTRGIRQWKRLWAVLRPMTLAFYKNEEEYSATLILPLSSIINAVEIDPISKSKRHCMQIIVEEKSYRFCAGDEEDLAKWLGALKSLLMKRKERQREREMDRLRNG